MLAFERKNFDDPEETLTPSRAKIQIVKIDGRLAKKMAFEPGWRWSEDMKPSAEADWDEQSHVGYQLSGHLHVLMKDGQEMDFGPGDLQLIPPGHDAWVVGDEPVVMLDFVGLLESGAESG